MLEEYETDYISRDTLNLLQRRYDEVREELRKNNEIVARLRDDVGELYAIITASGEDSLIQDARKVLNRS